MSCDCTGNFCKKYNRELKPRHILMCKGETELPKEKEQWYLEYYYGVPPEPNIFLKAQNFAGALIEHASSGFENVEKNEYERRISICKECPFKREVGNNIYCNKCGCKMSGNIFSKARWASQKCPENKW